MKSDLHDYITGAYVRALLNDRMEEEFARARRYGHPISLLMMDIDHFKSINDAFGHSRGDQALAEVAARIKSQIRQFDEVFRYGGDEFVVLLPETEVEQADLLARRILENISGSPLSGKPPLTLTVSVGTAAYPRDASTPQELFEKADKRSYQSKLLGRARVTSFDEEDLSLRAAAFNRLIERDQALARLKEAIDAALASPRFLLKLGGKKSAGFTRFLEEAKSLLNLRGCAALWIGGRPALQTRMGGAIDEALRGWENSPKRITADAVGGFLSAWIQRENFNGLALLLDDWRCFDEASREIVKLLFADKRLPQLTLVYGESDSETTPAFENLKTQRAEIRLNPLSESGARVWLRNHLRRELSIQAVRVIAEVSGGLPANLAALADWLFKTKRGALDLRSKAQTTRFRQECTDALKSRDNKPRFLPEQTSSFFGRQDEILKIKQALRERRLITITGVDGAGKTRLAAQSAGEMSEHFEDGIFFVSFENAIPSRPLADVLAQALGFSLRSQDAPLEELLSRLSGLRLLLVLDGFDPERDDAAILGKIVEKNDSVKILVAALETLNLPGEFNLQIAGFPPPAPRAKPDDSPAIQMFLDRARRRADSAEDVESIGAICRLVDGSPLGIELASAWSNALSYTQIAQEIENSLSFLKSDEADGRQKSLVAIFDSIFDLFSPTEADTLKSLGIFKGGFSRQAAEQIAGASPFFLDALANKFLIRRCATARRYANNIAFSQYLFEKLNAEPEKVQRVVEKYSLYFLGLLREPKAADLQSKEILADVDNIRHAWRLMFEAGNFTALAPALSEWMAFLRNQGWFREALDLLIKLDAKTASLEQPETEARAFRIRIKASMGEFYYHVGRYENGIAAAEEGLQALQASPIRGLESDEVHLYRLLANNYGASGRYGEARKIYLRGADIAESLGDMDLLYTLMNSLGVVDYMSAQYESAISLTERALEIARKTGEKGRIIQALNNLGNMYFEMEDFEHAKRCQFEALENLPYTEGKTLKGAALDTMGKILTACGEYEAACQIFLQGLVLIKDIEAVPLTVEMLVGVAELWNRMGDSPLAMSLVQPLVNHPSASHDILTRAARLQEDLNARRVIAAAEHSWQADQVRYMADDVIRVLEEQYPEV